MMRTRAVDQPTILRALELANRAPSVHNTQPWHWYLGPHSVHLYADLHRWLPATDADGRDLVISCGAALHHARVALAAMECPTLVRRQPNPDEPDHLASLELSSGRAAEADLGLASAITRRRTDRRAYTSWPVPAAFLDELTAKASEHGAVLRLIGHAARRTVLDAIHQAEQLQHGTPGYETELALWSGRRASDDGIPATNVPTREPRRSQFARRFAGGELGGVELGGVDLVDDGGQLVVIGTASDDTLSQLRAGEALSAVLLHATELGLASCPLSQPFEVSSTRGLVRDAVLDGALAPHVIVRVGWARSGPALPPSPRRPVADTVSQLDL